MLKASLSLYLVVNATFETDEILYKIKTIELIVFK